MARNHQRVIDHGGSRDHATSREISVQRSDGRSCDHACEQTKDKLMQAALAVFARKGFAGATVREICAKAGANVAAVNYHFGGKETLYYEVLRHIFSHPDRFKSPLLGEAGKGHSPEERLESFIRAMAMQVYGEDMKEGRDWDMGAVFLMEMANPTKILDQVVQEFATGHHMELEAIIAEYLGLPQDDPTVRKCKFSVMGQILHHACFWPMTSRVYPDLPHPGKQPEELAKHIYEFSLGGLERIRRSLGNAENEGATNAE